MSTFLLDADGNAVARVTGYDTDGFPILSRPEEAPDPDDDDGPKHHPAQEGATPPGDWGPEDYPF